MKIKELSNQDLVGAYEFYYYARDLISKEDFFQIRLEYVRRISLHNHGYRWRYEDMLKRVK